MEHTCLICKKPAVKKVYTSANQGDFYLCEKDVCKEVLESELRSYSKN